MLSFSIGHRVMILEPRKLLLCYKIASATVKITSLKAWKHIFPPAFLNPQDTAHLLFSFALCLQVNLLYLTGDFFFCLQFIMQLSRGHCKSIAMFCRTNMLLINRLLRLCFMGSCPGSLASIQGSTTLQERPLAAVTVGLWANILNRNRVLILACVPSRDSKAS